MTEAEKELERQRDAYKAKLKTYLQGLWGCGWEEPFNKAVKEIEGDKMNEQSLRGEWLFC